MCVLVASEREEGKKKERKENEEGKKVAINENQKRVKEKGRTEATKMKNEEK
jgi:hypothetical protein